MGNCSLKGVTGDCHHSIRVVSEWGNVLQFRGPKTVGDVLRHYPGYAIYRQGHAPSPLQEQESLCYGFLYYLLPLELEETDSNTNSHNGLSESESAWTSDNGAVQNLPNGSALEVLPSAGNGFWRVKLMIDTRQLEEILSEQVNTEALIEKMRMAASLTSPRPTTSTRRRASITSWKLGPRRPTTL